MIRLLSGKVVRIHTNAVVILVHGTGYLVHTPNPALAFTVDDTVTLHTHLVVRETVLDLYGFTHESELDLFELLLTVPKIGPKSALQILTQASPTLLVESIGKKDATQLHKLSGIGKKTCENIVLHLYEKLEHIGFSNGSDNEVLTKGAKADAIDALVSLGYDLATARSTITEFSDELTVNELVTKALKEIN